MSLSYHQIDQIVVDVITVRPLPLRPQDLSPAERERLELTASQEGVTPEYVLNSSRRRLLCELADRQEARRIALMARGAGTPNVC